MIDKNLTELANLNQKFEIVSPESILIWAADRFGNRIVATSSFQQNSIVLLHMVSRTVPEIPIVFIDTRFHFRETLAFKDALTERFKLNVLVIQSSMKWVDLVETHGVDLYIHDQDLCCHINRVVPWRQALKGFEVWITGIRRTQSPTRVHTPIVAIENSCYKIAPLANWTQTQVEEYITQNNLPSHPLHERGYLSIGCWPCTSPVTTGEHRRSGRWPGTNKIECGLHDVYYQQPEADP